MTKKLMLNLAFAAENCESAALPIHAEYRNKDHDNCGMDELQKYLDDARSRSHGARSHLRSSVAVVTGHKASE